MRPIDRSEVLATVGAVLMGAGAVSAELAWLHARAMDAQGLLCGASEPHCAWCALAVAGLTAGAATLWLAFRPAPAVAVGSGERR